MMAPWKRVVDGATSKGKVITTTGGTTPPPTNNQPHIEDTDSFYHQSLPPMSNRHSNKKTHSFRCSMRWERKWRNNSCDLIMSGSIWFSISKTSFGNKRSWGCLTNAPGPSHSYPEQLYTNWGQLREQHVFRSSCPRWADLEANRGGQPASPPNPNFHIHYSISPRISKSVNFWGNLWLPLSTIHLERVIQFSTISLLGSEKYCFYHDCKGHQTVYCWALWRYLEELV